MTVSNEAYAEVQAECLRLRQRVAALEQQLATVQAEVPPEAALNGRETRLQDLATAGFEGIAIIEQGVIVDVNPQLLQLLGYEPDEIIGKLAWEFVATEDYEFIGRTSQPGIVLPYEHGMTRKDGSLLFVEILAKPTLYQGRPARVIALRDITGRKQIELKLRQNQALLQAIMDNSSANIYVKDMEGRYVLVNQRIVELYDLDPGQVQGKTDYDFMPPAVADRLYKNDKEVIATGHAIETEEQILLPDGIHHYIAIKFPLYAEDGTPYGLCGISTDITERKRAEESLRESEERFRAIFDRAPIGIELSDRDGRIVKANSILQEMLGYTEDELLQMTFADFSHPDDRATSVVSYQRMIDGEVDTYLIEKRYMHKTGRPVWVQVTVSVIRDATGQAQYAIGVVEDITERRRVDQERAELQAQVINAQQAALRELSTPLIPVSDDVVIMPLIGTVDSQRAQQVMEVLLEGVAQYQADTVILDITGVQVVDTQVANAFIRTAQAVKLIGARIMITGIQPEMAQTLIQLGIDLSGIQTHGTLQSGIAAALKRR